MINIEAYKQNRAIEAHKLRLKQKIEIVESGCWNWTGSLYDNGYGRVRFEGLHIRAHRLSYNLYKGEIPEGFCVCHKCDNPKYINPKHLFLGTMKDNMLDSDQKGRYYQKFIKGEIPPNTKLTKDHIIAIRMDLQKMFQDLANKYNVSPEIIKNINSGRTFKDI